MHTHRRTCERRRADALTVLVALGGLIFGLQFVRADEPFPYRQKPVDYFGDSTDDPASLWGAKGKTAPRFLEGTGYLRDTLRALGVPESSQILVYSKTSLNARRISPRNPRAIYFNDHTLVGWVPGSPALELMSLDSRKGAIFLTLQNEAGSPPKLQRDDSCLLCHVSSNSLQVPGFLIRSFVTDRDGHPKHGYSQVHGATPFEKRWGGWFVTGVDANWSHMGNRALDGKGVDDETVLTLPDDLRPPPSPKKGEPKPTSSPGEAAGKPSPDMTAERYLVAGSDVVPLLVFDHICHVHNLITRVKYERAFERKEDSTEELLQFLLSANEPEWPGSLSKDRPYVKWFEAQGPRDALGRSFRELDLRRHLFRYRMSPLIYSPALLALPEPIRIRLRTRLLALCDEPRSEPPFEHLTRADKQAIREILTATHPWFRGVADKEKSETRGTKSETDSKPEA